MNILLLSTLLITVVIAATANNAFAQSENMKDMVKKGAKDILDASQNIREVGSIAKLCSTYMSMGFEEELVPCLNFVKEFNASVELVLENYKNRN